jgi:stress-induced morphogen
MPQFQSEASMLVPSTQEGRIGKLDRLIPVFPVGQVNQKFILIIHEEDLAGKDVVAQQKIIAEAIKKEWAQKQMHAGMQFTVE